MHQGSPGTSLAAASAGVRQLLPALLVGVALAVTAPACGGGAEAPRAGDDLQEVELPRFDVAVSVPRSWSAIDDESSDADVDQFRREHPRYFDLASAAVQREEGGAVLVAAEPGGDTHVLLSATPAAPGYTLERHVRESLAGLDRAAEEQPELGVRIEGPRFDFVELAGGDAWSIRWSLEGDHGRVQLLQHTFVRDGLLVLCTYATQKPYARAAGLFARSSETIRIGPG